MVGCYFSSRGRFRAEESLQELEALAEAAGALVLDRVLQWRPSPDPALFVGKGKAEELRLRVADQRLDLLIFDEELSPGQQRNLENKASCKILDRTQLILDIFARRARTREGKLQVELAQLNYLLPRLSGKGTMLSRLGAGIGTRGPGETKLEMDRRRIRSRIALLNRDLEHIKTHRQLQRSKRQGIPLPVVSLVGYTNAGKSTLFNALTKADTVESDQPFATLDPLLRRITLPNRLEIVLSDTVGFVRKLPHDLVAAFRATLEEVRAADLLLHVIDISNADWREQAAAVDDVLGQLEVRSTPIILVYNKTDLLSSGIPVAAETESERKVSASPAVTRRPVFVSAKTRAGITRLVAQIMEALDYFTVRTELKIPYQRAGLIARLRAESRIESEVYEEDGVRIKAEVPRSTARLLGEYTLPPTNKPPRHRE